MVNILFPKGDGKKKHRKHGKSIMPAYGGCYLCRLLEGDDRKKNTEAHHIYFGPNRSRSEEYGFVTRLCPEHHRTGPAAVHKNAEVCRILQRECQKEFEKTHSREEFIKIIGRNYL